MDSTKQHGKVKDEEIANLYSSLQAVIERPLPPSNNNNNNDNDTKSADEAKFIPPPPSLPISPSSSSPIIQLKPTATTSLTTPRDSNLDCPCQKIIDKQDIRHCALCRSTIPIIEELLSEKNNHENEIAILEEQLKHEQSGLLSKWNLLKCSTVV
ncbi:unnamed protein product [Rhizopus microsporus]